MRLTLIALLLAGVVGCDPTPEEPVSEFDVTPEEPVPVDSETALVDAAEQGDAEAQYKLGFMYEGSDSVPEDYAEAAKWYRKAAEQGHVEAQYGLGGPGPRHPRRDDGARQHRLAGCEDGQARRGGDGGRRQELSLRHLRRHANVQGYAVPRR